jgi:predicted Zn-dependent protease
MLKPVSVQTTRKILWGSGIYLIAATATGAISSTAISSTAVAPGGSTGHPCPPALAISPLEPPAELAGRSQRLLAERYAQPAQPPGADYRQRIATSPWGPPILPSWCVWIEPAADSPGAAAEGERWSGAVEAALASWGELVRLQRVDDPQRAQVLLLRRRPPRREEANGRLRASNGRSQLSLVLVRRRQQQLLEPRVIVWLNPGQRQQVIQAAALHELGHAFGLWGHSDESADAMAASPASPPVLRLTSRDVATWRWLQSLPSKFGQPWFAAPAAGSAVPAAGSAAPASGSAVGP